MEFVKFILFIVAIAILFYLAEKGLRKLLNIEKPAKNRPRFINKVHQYGEFILIGAFIVSHFYIIEHFLETRWWPLTGIFFFIVIFLFRAIMEWIYQPQQREYIIHLFGVLFLAIFIVTNLTTNWMDRLFNF